MIPVDKAVSENYVHGALLEAIQTAITKLGKTIDSVTIKDLAPVDEFHIGGRLATKTFIDQLDFSEQDHVLDVGCGLGGASRFVASKYKNQVTGIDLVQEYIDAGNVLCSWVGMDKQITLQQGSALSMPFEDEAFDGGYMMHVGMNIEDKTQLFGEIYRVLRPGAPFGVYDVMRCKDGELLYPVPWAAKSSANKLATPEKYSQTIVDAGFEVVRVNNRRDFALNIFKQMRAKKKVSSGPSPLGLHTLLQKSTAERVKNMIANISQDVISPVEVIAKKRE